MLCPTSGVKSAAQPPFLHHAIVPEGTILCIRIRRHPHRTDCWITAFFEPLTDGAEERSDEPKLRKDFACGLHALCITPHIMSTDYGNPHGRSKLFRCYPSISCLLSIYFSSYRSHSLHAAEYMISLLLFLRNTLSRCFLYMHASYRMCIRCTLGLYASITPLSIVCSV